MKQLFLFVFASVVLTLGACSTAANANNDDPKERKEDIALDLTQRIRMLSGVIVRGERGSAEITISGPNSFSGNTSPLFVMDGRQIDSYATLYSLVNTADIKRVEILKDPVQTSFYGARGANGVIKVTTDLE